MCDGEEEEQPHHEAHLAAYMYGFVHWFVRTSFTLWIHVTLLF